MPISCALHGCDMCARALQAHHPEEKEGGNIKRHMRMQQQGIRVWRMIILPKLQMSPAEFIEKYNASEKSTLPNTCSGAQGFAL